MRVISHHNVGTEYRLHHLGMQRIGNSRSQSSSDRHGKKCRIQTMPVGKPEANIGSTAGGINLQLFPQALDDVHHLATRGIDGANRHYQRVYNNI